MIKRKEGFTLIETIISLAIVGVIMILFVSIFSVSSKLIFRSESLNQSSMQAAGNLENQSTLTRTIPNQQVTIVISRYSYKSQITIEEYQAGEVSYRKAVKQNETP